MSSNPKLEMARLSFNALSRKDRLAILSELNGSPAPQAQAERVSMPRVVSANSTAEMLNRSPRLVHKLAAEGLLIRVTLPGRKRSCGFTAESVERLLRSMKVSEPSPQTVTALEEGKTP